MKGRRLDVALAVAQIIVIVVILAGSLWLWKRNYAECRAAGFSALYCGSRR